MGIRGDSGVDHHRSKLSSSHAILGFDRKNRKSA